MRKFFTVIARSIAAICAILFVITMVLALFLSTFGRQMFKANLYKQALAEEGVYDQLPAILGETLVSTAFYDPCEQNPLSCKIDNASPELQACLKTALGQDAYVAIGSGIRKPSDSELQLSQPCLDQFEQPGTSTPAVENGMPAFMQNLNASDWETIIRSIIPPQELRLMTEDILDQAFSYLNEDTKVINLSLVAIKNRLSGQSGVDVIRQLLSAQAPCTQAQLDQISSTTGTEGAGLVLCNPTETDFNKVMRQVQEQLDAAISQLPDEVPLIKETSPATAPVDNQPLGNDPIRFLRMGRLVFQLSPLVPLGFLLLVTLFAVRSLKSWMGWWGVPFFFAGPITLASGFSLFPTSNWAWNTYVVGQIPASFPASLSAVGRALLQNIVHAISTGIILQAVILTLVGLAAWIGSSFIKKKIEPQTQVAAPTP